jgi:uncharacterized membrane protein YqiK
MGILSILISAVIVGVIAIVIAVRLLSWLYVKSSGEMAFVRTGFGGRKVVRDGGAFVIPVLHQTVPVNMNTLRLEVGRSARNALITKDKMRVDVIADFYVHVDPDHAAIATAAQTLGSRAMNADSLIGLVEGKFVDVLRSAAAEMTMDDIHVRRSEFVSRTRNLIGDELTKNGLVLESISLTHLDQTGREHLDPQNAFDAEGLTALTKTIEDRRKTRNSIEQDTAIAIRQKELAVQRDQLEIEKAKLEIDRDRELARLAQEQSVAFERARQSMEIAREEAAQKRDARASVIVSDQAIEQAKIRASQEVEEARIAIDRNLDALREAARQEVAQARIEAERRVRTWEIEKQRDVDLASVERSKLVAIAEEQRAVEIADKSKARSLAEASASKARVEATRAAEEIVTAQEVERANRKQALSVIEAERLRVEARSESDTEAMNIETAKRRYETDADGKRALNEAENALSARHTAMKVKLAILERLPEIIRESARPMEQIDEIKIIQVEGIGKSASGGDGGNTAGGGNSNVPPDDRNFADQLVSSALRYRAQAPLVDSILEQVGLNGKSLGGLVAPLANGAGRDEDAGRRATPQAEHHGRNGK